LNVVADPWLPVGFKLPDGNVCRGALNEGPEWQIVETADGGRALLARSGLVDRWRREGLLDAAALNAVKFGDADLAVFTSAPRFALYGLQDAPSPANHSEAKAFAVSLRESRHRCQGASFHDGVYVERISRILPSWSLSGGEPDDLVLGRWLSGGVRVSTNAFRRLASLLSWLPSEELRDLVKSAGLAVSDEDVAIPARGGPSDAVGAVELGKEPSVKRETGRQAEFRLPGRERLESFFREHVIDIVEHGERYKALGVEFPSPIALYGPPGSGKTFAVERLVEYLGWPCFSIDSSTIGSPYIHETGKKIAKAFEDALKSSPAVIVIDEMESFLADRQMGGGQGLHHVEEVAEFLRRIPEAIKNHVLLVGMTNRIEMIDPAILRRGRFDNVIQVDMPSADEVRNLVASLLATLPCDSTVNVGPLVARLEGRPLSDAAFAIREAGRLAAKQGRDRVSQESLLGAVASLPERATGDASSRPIGFSKA
jgi:hypothetical protein